MSSAVTLRTATEADLDRLVEIHSSCYPDDRGDGARRLSFAQNALGRLDDLRVAERDGRIVGHGFGFRIGAHFGGAVVPTLAIASVGVAPEARGTGVGAAIVAGLERDGRARGATLAVLHAFRHGFYARLGYGDVTPNRRLACDPRAVPAAWVRLARSAGLRAADGSDSARIALLYARAAALATGWIERPASLWTRRFANERVHHVLLPDAGYVAFELVQRAPHARTELHVRELVADGDDARRTLWGFLGMQAGQIAEIQIEVDASDAITFALVDVDGARHGDEDVEHDLGRVVAGPVVRVLDACAALAARGWPRDGEAHLLVDGQPMQVMARAGRATATEDARDPLELDGRTLASVAFGGLRASDAARLDLARGAAASIARADDLFRLPPFFTLDRF